MDLRVLHRIPAAIAAASILALAGCGGGGAALTPPLTGNNTTLTISPQETSIPVNTTVTFTSNATSSPTQPMWALSAYAYGNLGTPTTFDGPSFVYTAPATPPIYTGAGVSNIQGTVTLNASVQVENTVGAFLFDTASETFVITAPSVTAGITPATANVALNATLQLNAYAVGNINNAVTLQVNGVPGGSTSTGTIVHTTSQFPEFYLYTAPASMPTTGSTVTITVISQADPTKTASAILTLQ